MKRRSISVLIILVILLSQINTYVTVEGSEFDSNILYNDSINLFPQVQNNSDFPIRGYGIFESIENFTYKYDYSQNQQWTWHGFDISVDMDNYYTFSFDAYISNNSNISNVGSTFIAQEEIGVSNPFFYDNTKKGTWQHFEYTAKPSSAVVRAILYPTTSEIFATTGYILYRNVEFKADNIYPQPKDNNSFTIKGNGNFNVQESYIYRYDYSQNLPWSYHSFDIPVDVSKNYTYSFDAFISLDANIANSGSTMIANEERGVAYTFFYDNNKKGTWQHFEYTAKPNSTVVRTSLYPTTSEIPATTGYILFRNVEFKQSDEITNLFPQVKNNSDFPILGNGIIESRDNFIYIYDYSQNLPWTYHSYDMSVDVNKYYTFSFDAYISSDANISGTGTTMIANEENGVGYTFYYDNSKKGTWQHFEYTAKPNSTVVRTALYPSTSEIPATTGYILYRNVEFNGHNLYSQPNDNDGFAVKGNGIMNVQTNYIYRYSYLQNLPWTYHGFDISVDPDRYYTFSFDAYISPSANISDVGTTMISNEENGVWYTFCYDNSKKGTWQHFEYTAKPSSTIVRPLLYPTTSNVPALTGYILYRNVEFKDAASANIFTYEYDPFNNKLIAVYKNGQKVYEFIYDNNGNLIGTQSNK